MSKQIEGTNYMQIAPMSDEQKFKTYMKSPKAELAKMLVNCNNILDQIRPMVNIGVAAYNKFVPAVASAVSRSADKNEANEREKKMIRIFQWLTGYRGDFPERKNGQGAYYWRTPLTAKLKRLGIDCSKRVSHKK